MLNRTAAPELDPVVLRRELQKTYARMALFPQRRYHLNTGAHSRSGSGIPPRISRPCPLLPSIRGVARATRSRW